MDRNLEPMWDRDDYSAITDNVPTSTVILCLAQPVNPLELDVLGVLNSANVFKKVPEDVLSVLASTRSCIVLGIFCNSFEFYVFPSAISL